jgi:hypothetical protein
MKWATRSWISLRVFWVLSRISYAPMDEDFLTAKTLPSRPIRQRTSRLGAEVHFISRHLRTDCMFKVHYHTTSS